MNSETDDQMNPEAQGDLITALDYDASGEFLGWGDRNGRVTVLKLDSSQGQAKGSVDSDNCKGGGNIGDGKLPEPPSQRWLHYSVFQSHEAEFDFLKSLEIEPKINQLAFLPRIANNLFLLSANDKTVKLWKVGSRRRYAPACVSRFVHQRTLCMPTIPSRSGGGGDASSPAEDSFLHASNKCTYSNAHAYHINSLGVCEGGERFLSADDLRINMWNVEKPDVAYSLLDIKPPNMEELTEVITAIALHPSASSCVAYASSRGSVKVGDMRTRAFIQDYVQVYSDSSLGAGSKSFITDILNSISDISYSADGRFLVSRDYLTLKIWDVNMCSRPVKTVHIHDYLRPMLYDLYTSDIIFDKFEVACSRDGMYVASGSYSNQLKVFSQEGRGVLRNVDLPSGHNTSEGLLPGGEGLAVVPDSSVSEVSLAGGGGGTLALRHRMRTAASSSTAQEEGGDDQDGDQPMKQHGGFGIALHRRLSEISTC
eukprot:gene36343-44087_t